MSAVCARSALAIIVALLAAAGCHQARGPVQGQPSPYIVRVLAVERVDAHEN
jgi:hypothetical protein